MDRDNFEYNIGPFHVVMDNGELVINNCSYERLDNDPTYMFAIEIAKARGLIEQ